jgi:hypothetical protein
MAIGHRFEYIFWDKTEIFLMLISVVYVAITVFSKFIKGPRTIKIITMSF